ncbi:hypothetical protein N7481_009225 [Penicillium waksmanii]|uniref:uncharacterized protein n=1 Tax=Penicillium waksmanii TaxID=69791 RepID=UPI0025483BE7|nr:uncharacterized protein N7481_009225 [Penicillium waksmanii]KAJ5975518.1 hypothetical protein N7481_009225 [Penicillium waksmanii]
MSGSGPEQPFGSRNRQPPPFGRQSSAPSFSQSPDDPHGSSTFEVSPMTTFPHSTYTSPLRSGLDWQTRAATANHLLSSGQPDHSHHHPSGRDSPDPDDFYRQQDRLTTEDPHVTSNFGDATAGANDGMASGYGDLNDRVSPLPTNVLDPSRQRRSEYRSVSDSPTLGGPVPNALSAASSLRPRQSRQSSFKDLINKFNNTSDNVLPLPSISRTTSRTASPAGSADGSERHQTFPRRRTLRDSPPHGSITRHPKPLLNSTHQYSEEERFVPGQLDAAEVVPPPLFQRIPKSYPRRPLFGELLSVNTELNNLGFGLPAHLKRRGSDGSLPSPNPAFLDQSNPPSALSPLTPTAWYLGQASSLEAVQPGASKTSSHRRVRSDLVGSTPREPQSLTDPWDPDMAVATPLQLAKAGYGSPDSPGSPGSPNSRSRIPVSSRRLSTGSGPNNPTLNPTFSSRSTGIPLAPKGTSRLPKPSSKDSSPTRMAADGPASFAMTARGRRDLTIGRTRSQVPERNQLLQAYIAAPPPKKSPPLRSSRPRQPVSHGIPNSPRSKVGERVSSFQKSSERDTEARPPRSRGRPLPELGNVDFETRRQRIQQAINRTVQENERKEEAAVELRRRAWERDAARGEVDSPAEDEVTTPDTATTTTAQPFEMSTTVVTETAAPPGASENEPHTVPQLHLNTANNVPDSDVNHTTMDSPTLGIPDELSRAPRIASDPMVNDVPHSATTSDSSGTHVTTFDPEPQSGLQERQPSLSHQTILDHIMQIREPSSGSESCDEPDCSISDTEDKESIQIMLRNSNYPKSEGTANNAEDPSGSTINPRTQALVHPNNRWSMSSWSSSLRHQNSTCDESGDEVTMYAPNSQHEIESTNQSCSAASSSPETDEAGDYPFQDIGVMGPDTLEAMQTRPAQVFSTPPSLARQGRWSSRAATQLYLQELTRTQHTNIPSPVPEEHRPHERDLRTDGRVNSLTEDPVVIPGYQEIPVDDTFRPGASLRGPEDWEHASPSMYDWLKIQAEHEAATPQTDDLQFSPEEMPTPRMGYSTQASEPGNAQSGLGLSLQKGPEEIPRRPVELPADSNTTFDSSAYPPTSIAPALRVSHSAGSSDDSSFRPLEPTQSPQAADSSATSLAPSEHRVHVEARKSPSPEQRRLKKRRHIIKELVDTEYKFGRDMKVVDDIYKGTAGSCSDLTKDDIRIIFGNSDQVVQFSFAFQDTLKKATRSIYVMPKSQRWSSKRSTQNGRPGSCGPDGLTNPSTSESYLEKDRSTSVGEAFLAHLSQMEKAHATNLKTRDPANKKLETMQQKQNVTIWLNECREWASDLTDAWDLSSLLVKPFQRVLKYPLLLTSLLESTPTDHPDYVNLVAALQKTNEMTERLNKLKGRIELFDQALGRGRKESDVRANLTKAFGRRTEKLRQQVGLSDILDDKVYAAMACRFDEKMLQLRVIVSDIGLYNSQAEQFAEQLLEVSLAIEEMIDVAKTGYPELESKWRHFKTTTVEIRTVLVTEHIEAVQKAVRQPIEELVAMHSKAFRAMQRREKRLLDHARYKVLEERGDTPDKKLKEQEAHFQAIDETLKEELPQLYNLSWKLTQACLKNFVHLQSSFLMALQRKLEPHVEGLPVDFPVDFQKILSDWTNDHGFAEAQVLTLGICNGSLLADAVNLVNFNTPSTNVNSPRRPSTVNSSTHRPDSMTEDSPKVSHDYGGVGQLFQSPQIDSQSSFSRTRANSTFSGRAPPETPETGRSQLLQQITNSSSTPSIAQAPKPVETESFPSLPRLSLDTPFLAEMISASSSDHNLPTSPAGRYSGFFSSAMPMSDNPHEENHVDNHPPVEHHPSAPRVLFLAASVEQFHYEGERRGEAGYPYLTYESGDIFDVIGEKGELWLARNQDDDLHQVGWIWNRHFSKVGS